MKNYGRMHRAETMYCMLLPYKDSMKEDVPAKIRLMLAVNKWINPWHALTELSKQIPFKRRQKIKELNDEHLRPRNHRDKHKQGHIIPLLGSPDEDHRRAKF